MKRFKNIIYYADSAETKSRTLKRAVALAESNDAALTLMDVIEESDLAEEVEERFEIDLNALLRQRRLEELELIIKPHRKRGLRINTQVVMGTPFIEIIRAVLFHDYDLLIKTAHSPEGMVERLFGSNDMHILRKCPCPVWVDNPGSNHPYRNIVVAVDPINQASYGMNRLIMDVATSLAEKESARLHVIHAWWLEGETKLQFGRAKIPADKLQKILDTTVEKHKEKLNDLLLNYGLSTESPNVNLVKAKASEAILTVSKAASADLIVMGTVGRTGIPGLIIGNTAEDVLQTTEISVLAVKPSGFVSPVTLP